MSQKTIDAKVQEIAMRLSEWHDRATFYQDADAISHTRVVQNVETLMQLVDELTDSLEPTYLSFLANRLQTANTHISNLLRNCTDENINAASEYLNFIHLKD